MNTDYLAGWDPKEQQLRSDFMYHLYLCSGRTNGLYTGLWQEFCTKEAGPYCRNLWKERQDAIKEFVAYQNQQKTVNITKESFVPTLHD